MSVVGGARVIHLAPACALSVRSPTVASCLSHSRIRFQLALFRSTISKSLILQAYFANLTAKLEPEHGRGLGVDRAYRNQFSTLREGTRLNSATLSVTHTASIARAWAAISMSWAPIGVPFFSNATRIAA